MPRRRGAQARGILRLSGPEAVRCVARFFRAASGRPLGAAAPRSVIAGWLDLPGLHSSLPCDAYLWTGRSVVGCRSSVVSGQCETASDRASFSADRPQTATTDHWSLAIDHCSNPFPSYTGQPVVEIHTVGSPPLLELVLRSFCDAGARLAGPGEFTLRAFLAGRIDLGQAEAVLGVIDAADRRNLDVALAQLAGGLAHPLHRLRDALLELLAELEAGFDFPDERIPFITLEQLGERLGDARRQVDCLLAQMACRSAAGSGPRVVLVGRPNAGKSSLVNALAGRPAALVSAHPGTTRDYLTAELDLGGIKCQLIDTAGEPGVRDRGGEGERRRGGDCAVTRDPLVSPSCSRSSVPGQPTIEQAARAVAADQRRLADIEMLCIDATCPPEASQLEQLRTLDGRTIVVVTKWDEQGRAACWQRDLLDSAVCVVSSRTGEGLAELKSELRRRLAALRSGRGEVVGATAARCHESLRIVGGCIDRARSVALMGQEELAAAEIRIALEDLGRVTGAVYTDDVLDQIFSRFCIGK